MEEVVNKKKRITLNVKIKEIAQNYFYAKKRIKEINNLSEIGNVNEYQQYIDKVEKVFYELDPLEQTLINNDFFYQEYPDWWEKAYNKSEYYYVKGKVMRRFMELFNAA